MTEMRLQPYEPNRVVVEEHGEYYPYHTGLLMMQQCYWCPYKTFVSWLLKCQLSSVFSETGKNLSEIGTPAILKKAPFSKYKRFPRDEVWINIDQYDIFPSVIAICTVLNHPNNSNHIVYMSDTLTKECQTLRDITRPTETGTHPYVHSRDSFERRFKLTWNPKPPSK